MSALYLASQLGLALLLSLVSLAQAQRTDGLALWWQFAEAGGAKVYDSSGAQNHGTLTALNTRITYAKGVRGISTLRSTYSPIIAANAPELNPGTGNFTVALWHLNKQPATDIVIAMKSLYAGGENGLYLYAAGGLYRYYYDTGELQFGAVPGTSVFTHIVVVRTGTTITIYTNGALAATGTDSRNLTNSRDVTFGAATNDTVNNCDCVYREVLLANRAFSAAEIQQLYQQGLVQPQASPLLPEFGLALLLQPRVKRRVLIQ